MFSVDRLADLLVRGHPRGAALDRALEGSRPDAELIVIGRPQSQLLGVDAVLDGDRVHVRAPPR